MPGAKGWSISAGWCTRDWGGGSSYATNGLRDMLQTVWISRHQGPGDRQAPQWSVWGVIPGTEAWRDSYVLLVDFKTADIILEHWPGSRPEGTRPKIRYLHTNPKNWRQSNWFKEKK